MNEPDAQRQPHAVLDLHSRNAKALKIERLLDLKERSQPLRMLEVGTGAGGVAHYFAKHSALHCEVTAVDVHDNLLARDGFHFRQVEGVELPFEDASFDVVISNHVIEHVGDKDAQHKHLTEIRRVMCRGAIGYLAVPNRWMLTEPHYRLKFLSWWPRSWRTPYLRLMRKGTFYDCEPLQMRQLERMLAEADFKYRNLCIEALRETLEIEMPAALSTRLLGRVPNSLLAPMKPIIPTLIYRVAPSDKSVGLIHPITAS